MDAQEQSFLKGYNGGYLLEQYEPDLLAKVLKGLDLSNDYLLGLSEGQREYQQDRMRLELDALSKLREQSKGRDRDVERGG